MKTFISIILVLFSVSLGALAISTTGLDVESSLAVAFIVSIVMSFVSTKKHGFALVTICGALTEDILKDCDDPLQSGTRDELKIMNFADITLTRDVVTGAITAITQTVPGSAVVIDGQKNSIAPRAEMVKVGVYKRFDHEIKAMGFSISPIIKKDLESAKDGLYIGVVENFFKGADGSAAFEIYGADNGLELDALTREANNTDTQGGFEFTFFTDTNKEPRLPASFFLTDYATTKALYIAL